MYANAQAETISRTDLESLQLERLKKIVEWAYEKSAYYHQLFRRRKINPDVIQSLSDIKRLPFLNLSTLHRTDALDILTLPFLNLSTLHRTDALDILTLPLSSVLRFSHIIESTGEMTKLYTKGDVLRNVELMSRCLVAAGINNASIVGLQGEMSDSRVLDVLYALEAMGATVVALGTDYRQWLRLMELTTIDTLISTPQLIMQLIIQLQAIEKNIVDYPISKIVCLNTNTIQNPLQQHIRERTDSKVYNLFAPPELGSAGMLYQCDEHSGHHLQEDNYLAEVVHFDSEEIVEEDEHMGELVLTTLTAQAMPLIRYRTGQAVRRMSGQCECGRTFVRLATPYTGIKN